MRIERRAFLSALPIAFLPFAPARGATQAGPVICRIALAESRIWVAVKIGKAEPRLFILDTGASLNMINPDYAETLKLKHIIRTSSTGLGGVAEARRVKALDVSVGGGVRLEQVYFDTIKINYGRDAVGALAADAMTSMDSDLDVERQEWRIWPEGRKDWTGFTEVESDTDRQGPTAKIYVTVRVNGQPLRMLLDTGAPGNLVIGNRAAKRLGLWDDSRPYAPAQVRGIGGASEPGRFIKVDLTEFAGLPFKNAVSFIEGPKGSDRYGNDAEGIIGLNMLQHFTLSTDTKRGKLWVQRNAVRPVRMTYPLSAIWFEERDGKVVVDEVGTGSPAAAAGMKPGDVIVGETLRSAITKVRGEPGYMVVLKTLQNGVETPVSFALKPFL